MKNTFKALWSVFEFLMLLVLGVPSATLSYLLQHIEAGWMCGEWAFSPESFYRKYGGQKEIEEKIGRIAETVKKKGGAQ